MGASACNFAMPPIYVAFNPYFPSKAEAAEERKRMQRKLDSGLVRGIYLQMGTDLKLLKEGLDFLKEAGSTRQDSPIDLYGSIFLPSKRCGLADPLCPVTHMIEQLLRPRTHQDLEQLTMLGTRPLHLFYDPRLMIVSFNSLNCLAKHSCKAGCLPKCAFAHGMEFFLAMST